MLVTDRYSSEGVKVEGNEVVGEEEELAGSTFLLKERDILCVWYREGTSMSKGRFDFQIQTRLEVHGRDGSVPDL